jgi:GNAT superfamily N-acetyltransferase
MGRARREISAATMATRGGRSAPSVVQQAITDLRAAYPHATLYVGEGREYINLSLIELDDEDRGQGTGKAIMNALCQIADENERTITLTASPERGTSKAFLVAFYKSFGFVENKGKNKDYAISEGMYRLPR